MEPIRLHQDQTLLLVSLKGRLSEAEGTKLSAKAAKRLGGEGGARDLLLDLTEVEYMTSSAVGAVVGLYQKVRLGGGRMAVAAANERVHLLLEIAGLNQLLSLCKTVEEARAALAAGEPPK
jgi:anti-sigma B factor antagonist